MINSTMMNVPLVLTSVMNFAEKVYGSSEIVSITADNPRHRYTYRDAFRRVRQLGNVFRTLGVEIGESIGTMAWNDYRHLELYYATGASGLVCHTVNPRLFAHQLEFIINHGEDKWLFLDPAFVPIIEGIQDQLPNVKGFVVLTDEAHMPETTLRNVKCYETLLAAESDQITWPELDENHPCSMCYTSGTTGDPKGVVYSHRSTVLHAYAAALPDTFGVSVRDVVLPIVPMFHVNGWGLVYVVPMTGGKLVLPGPKMGDGEAICELINSEKVTLSAGVPTVWLALINYLESKGATVDSLQRITVGGAACPLSIITTMREKFGVEVRHAWGMTETSPLGTYNTPKPGMEGLPEAEMDAIRLKQGRPIFGVELRITDENNQELPWDGKSSGAVKVRGPWITGGYHKSENAAVDENGWFETGDVACIDPEGYMLITDRTKDVIKSGGEWISSIELENLAVDHPQVAEAAVIGVPHPKWTERPLLLAVLKEGASLSTQELLDWYEGKVAKWCIPSDCEFVASLPHTATGKLSKKDLREEFKDYEWSDIEQEPRETV
ncbi:long-chain-fatty-acid--CoA ligase [Gilvimarinus sp. F26214L]|uniref:long-chain-fatty-acid--CoA ligase n=1 Tax=Gilvimarinus sp. DZF01 TaxID=3461371 RepID=UPI004045696F